ncbi:hypothetical protein SDC9_200191 [bioreactor metagenome]|uniref:Uncharacterized protein n=1 Tax=bioreactor metagenome TaxID=1076179 RepID=A0A645IQC5_9ZZZZ
MLLHGQQIVHRRNLWDIAQHPLGLQRFVGISANFNVALKAQKPRDAFDHSGFSRAVGTQQHRRLPVVHEEADVLIGNGLAVFFGHVIDT